MSQPVYLAYYLAMGDAHQFAGLQHLIQWTDDVEMDPDGCLQFHGEPCEVDGYEPDPVDPNILIPIAAECIDRIHTILFEDGKPKLQAFCMLPACDKFKQVVSMSTCADCPLRRGRE